MKVSILIPVYNEAATVKRLIDHVQRVDLPIKKEILVINDGSTDGTYDLLKGRTDIKLLQHTKNQGKGAAIRTGLAAATGEIIVIQDADLEYDPSDLPAMIAPLLADTADVVYGSRFLEPRNTYRLHTYLANKLLSWLTRLVTPLPISDMESCYKAFKAPLIKSLQLTEDRFGIEPEITVKMATLSRIRYAEVPISYKGRSLREGKKIRWHDGAYALWYLFRYDRRKDR